MKPLLAIAILVSCLFASKALVGEDANLPNIVLILADDLGYGDLSCYGAPDIRTPHIDRLAADGVRLTDFHTNGPICTPSRVALLTGRYQQRTGLTTGIKYYDNDKLGLNLDERLLPEFLKQQGYATGIIGKWHLGRGKGLEYFPTRRGFDSFFGHPGGAMDYWTHKDQSGEEVLYRDLKKVQDEGYATNLFGEEAVRFVQRHTGRPFFLYLAFNAPHTPMQTPDRPFEPIEKLMKPLDIPDARQRFVKMVERMDRKIGDLLEALDQQGLRENTLVIFTSDNGGPQYCGRNLPLNGHKVALLEGGHRVPLIARWPGRIPRGTRYDGLCIGMDLFTTCIHAAGGRTPSDRKIDGVNLLPYFKGETTESAHDWLAWESHAERWLRRGYRKGSWKLRYMKSRSPSIDSIYQLFDLSKDIGESTNLRDERPDKLRELIANLARWERDVGIPSILPPSNQKEINNE